MFKSRRKIGSALGVVESESRMLRLFRSDHVLQASLISPEVMDKEGVYEYGWGDTRTAMLEAECNKAKALMAFQNRQRFY
jgi:hypothetical protein